jgi:predicted HicB family RNase H-like nuclease
MAVIKRPVVNRSDKQAISDLEVEAERFINRTDQVPPVKPAKKKKNKEPIIVRIDPDILERIDQRAAEEGISRSAWVVQSCALRLKDNP